MRIPTSKIELACGKNDIRAYLNMPHFDANQKAIVCTNGRILAVVNVEPEEGDTGGPIPLDAIKTARGKVAKGQVLLNGSAVSAGISYPRPDLGQFPDYRQAVPEKPDRAPDVTLNAEFLYDLARAISTGKQPVVSLWISGPENAVYVEPLNEGAHGALMPIRR